MRAPSREGRAGSKEALVHYMSLARESNAAYGSLECLLFEPGKRSCPTSNPPCIPPATAPHMSPCWAQQDQLLSSNYPSCCPFTHRHVAYPLLMALLFSSSNSMYSQANIPSNMTFQKESKGLSYG